MQRTHYSFLIFLVSSKFLSDEIDDICRRQNQPNIRSFAPHILGDSNPNFYSYFSHLYSQFLQLYFSKHGSLPNMWLNSLNGVVWYQCEHACNDENAKWWKEGVESLLFVHQIFQIWRYVIYYISVQYYTNCVSWKVTCEEAGHHMTLVYLGLYALLKM